MDHPVTPDDRYFVVRGRLWRRANPALSDQERQTHVHALMQARHAVRTALPEGGQPLAEAHAAVDAAKRTVGNAARSGGTTARRI